MTSNGVSTTRRQKQNIPLCKKPPGKPPGDPPPPPPPTCGWPCPGEYALYVIPYVYWSEDFQFEAGPSDRAVLQGNGSYHVTTYNEYFDLIDLTFCLSAGNQKVDYDLIKVTGARATGTFTYEDITNDSCSPFEQRWFDSFYVGPPEDDFITLDIGCTYP